MKHLKIIVVFGLVLLDIYIHLPAAQEVSTQSSIHSQSNKNWDEDRKILASMSTNQLQKTRADLIYHQQMLHQQIQMLSKQYGALNSQKKIDSAAIKAKESEQLFIINQLQTLEGYIEELDYQIERNNRDGRA